MTSKKTFKPALRYITLTLALCIAIGIGTNYYDHPGFGSSYDGDFVIKPKRIPVAAESYFFARLPYPHAGRMQFPNWEIYSSLVFKEGLAADCNEFGKWGYIDIHEKIILPHQFEEAHPFNGGLARVKRDGLYGFIDKSGKIVIPCEYVVAYDFDDNISTVQKDDLWFPIDQNGAKVFDLPNSIMWPFSEGYAVFVPRENIDRESEEDWENRTMGIVNSKGEVTMAPVKCRLENTVNNGLVFQTIIGDDGNQTSQFINVYGDSTFKDTPYIENARSFSEGIATFEDEHGNWCGMNLDGEVIFTTDFSLIQEFHEGLAVFRQGNRGYGYINTKGEIVIPPVFDYAMPFSEGYAFVDKDNKRGVIANPLLHSSKK